MMVKQISDDEFKDLKKIFNQIDTDNSGTIDAKELKQAYSKSGVGFSQMDLKQKGVVEAMIK